MTAKLKIGIPAMARIFTQFSDQLSTVEEFSDHYIYTIHKCPVCWNRKGDKPLCHAAVGLLQEGLRWVSGGHEFKVDELQCIAVGAPVCTFHINKEPVS